MTDNNETQELGQPEQQQPTFETFEITVTRQYEVDYPERQIMAMVEQADKDNPDEVVADMLAQQEQEKVAPTEKLLGIDVKANGSSDD